MSLSWPEMSNLVSLLAVIISALGYWNSLSALRLSRKKERDREPKIRLYLNESFFLSSNCVKIFALRVSVLNLSDAKNSIAHAHLHVTYALDDDRELTLKLPSHKKPNHPDFNEERDLDIPVQVDAHQTIAGWLFFSLPDDTVVSPQLNDYNLVLIDTHGFQAALQISIISPRRLQFEAAQRKV